MTEITKCDGCGQIMEPTPSQGWYYRIERRDSMRGYSGFVHALFTAVPDWPPPGDYCNARCIPKPDQPKEQT